MREAVERLLQRVRIDAGFSKAGQHLSQEMQDDLLEFLIFLSGGAPVYDGISVSRLLSPLCQTDEAYDLFVDHLATAMCVPERSPRLEVELRLMMEHIRVHVVDRHPAGIPGQESGAAVA